MKVIEKGNLSLDLDTNNNIITLADRDNYLDFVNSNSPFEFTSDEPLTKNGTDISASNEDNRKIMVSGLKDSVDYRFKVLEVLFKNYFGYTTETRLILDFGLTPKNYLIVNSKFNTLFDTTNYTITYNIKKSKLEGLMYNKYIELSTNSNYKISIEELRNKLRGLYINTPTQSITLHQSTETVDDKGNRVSINDPSIEISSFNYSQLKTKKNTEEYHEDRNPYLIGIYNQDYKNVKDGKPFRSQGIITQTPKHLFKIIDTSGVGTDRKTWKEQFIEYAALDGNYFKFISNTSIQSALECKTKEGHKVTFDSSNLMFEQYKYMNRKDKKLMYEDKPVNIIKFDKKTDNESLSIESHQTGKDNKNYDKILNSFKFSETPKLSQILLTNKTDKGENTIELKAGDNNSFKIVNKFDNGKENIIELTKELIKISDAQNKNIIEITPSNGIKITCEKYELKSNKNTDVSSPQKMVLGDNLKAYLDAVLQYISTHTHIDPMTGSTGMPTVPPSATLSTFDTVPVKKYLSSTNKNN